MTDPAPRRLVVVAGTGTDIGKTWVSAAVLHALRPRGVRVAARKPAQSFEPGDVVSGSTDAHVLAEATGERPEQVCPLHRWYEVPLAPPMAADLLGRPPFTLAELHREIEWPEGIELGLVETAGGVRSPLTSDDGDAVGLTGALMADVIVVVADAGLGTINSVRLTMAALAPMRASRESVELVVFLNRFDTENELHRRNRDWFLDRDGLSAVTSVDELVDKLVDEPVDERPG
jgi:dethiobiotin synthetase